MRIYDRRCVYPVVSPHMELSTLYNSVSTDFMPQLRSIREIRIILSRIYELLKSIKTLSFDIFENSLPSSPTDRTAVERTLYELEYYDRTPYNGHKVASEVLERTIYELQAYEKLVEGIKNNNYPAGANLIISGSLFAQLRYTMDLARTGLVNIRKMIITEQLQKCHSKSEKINYINGELISIEQQPDRIDKVQKKALIEFLTFELERWEKYIEEEQEIFFRSESELAEYIVGLIDNELTHQIELHSGYMNFWRDTDCAQPKRETEIQQYLKSILEPHCRIRDIKIHREAVSAEGAIDMTFTYLQFSVCLEIKKAHHQDLESSIKFQLPKYMEAERTNSGVLLVLWYKNKNFTEPPGYDSSKDLIKHLEEVNLHELSITTKIINCTKPISPSKLKA